MRPSPFSARSGSERVGTVGILGLLLLPLAIAGLLTWALWAPTTNLDRVSAAIVNDDVPVTVNGTSVPLGRQFAAGLIAGSPPTSSAAGDTPPSTSEPSASNFDWTLTNDKEATEGLASGRYEAVVTIPKSFSADATSLSGPAANAHQAKFTVETSPAAAFADPALSAAVTTAATAALNRQLTSQYLSNVYAGFNSINQQIGQAASGAASVSSGAAAVSSGAQSLASGASSLASGLQSLDAGAGALSSGLGTLDSRSQSLPGQTAQLAQGAAGVAAATDEVASAIDGATASLSQVVAQVCLTPGPICTAATNALARLQNADQAAARLAGGADAVAAGNRQLAAAMAPLVAAIGDSAAGAAELAAGAAQADSGAASVSSGATDLAGGAAQVDSGAAQLAAGLAQAVDQIPTYTESDITTLSAVASQPVLATQKTPAPGLQSVPLFATIALWFGALATALARKAVPTRPLLTTESSVTIALRSALIGVLIGLAQGLLVASVVQIGLGMRPDQWLGFAALAMVTGAVFAVFNQGLAAAFGSVGRLIAVLIGIIALGAGLTSTVPPVFESLAGLFPTAPALAMLRAGATGEAGGAWSGLGGALVFCVIGWALLLAGVASRRGVRALDLVSRRALTT
ncbi:YhgE/Pip domain-containing protein [Leifsonia sp. NPDC058230]|uniref:YhgE/Pip domain-containing protein n=1 Tax=Leifsonia sp. NPDC058230 TaxID=3346391 RepID=UPI0036DBB791